MRVVTANGAIELGTLQASPTIGITDYSRRVTDDYGITTVVPRGFAHRMSVTLGLPIDEVDDVQLALAELRTTKATWIADDRFGSLSFAGFYKDFELTLATALSLCTLTVEGTASTDGFVDPGGDPAPDGARSTLLLVDPVTVDDTTLTSSSVAEADAPAWSAGTSYAKGARVLRGAAHRIYESVVDGNVGHDPAGTDGQWLDVGPTSRWAMFDQALGSAAIAAEPIVVTLKPATAITALAALDTNAATVRVQAPGYDRTIAPSDAGKALFLDLAVAAGASVTVTLTPATGSPQPRRWDDGAAWMDDGVWRDSLAAGDGTVTIGTMLLGALRPIGVTEDRPTASIIDYSRKVTDDFGEVTVVPRSWAKKMSAAALLRTDAVDLVAGRLTTVRARPALWIGQEGLDSLIVYGFVKDWEITVDQGVSKLTLSIEGLSTAGKVEPFNPGGSVAWPDITDPTGTKPKNGADKTSENTARDTLAVGGKPALEITGELEELANSRVATDESLQALGRAGVDRDAAQRLLAHGGDMLAEAALRLTLDANRRAVAIRDAGIVIDPASGKARLFAVEEALGRSTRAEVTLDAQAALIRQRVTYADFELGIAEAQLAGKDIDLSGLYGRVSDAEIDIDGLAGQILLRATTAELSALGLTVSEIEQTLDSLGDVVGVTTDIRQVRRSTDEAARAILGGLVTQDRAGRGDRTAIVQARQELTARMDERDAIEARSRTQLGVALSDVEARLVVESRARIAAGVVTAEDIRSLGVTTGQQAGAIADLSRASIEQDKGLTVVRSTQRQQVALDDQTAEALLASLIAGDQIGRRARVQAVQVQSEQTTELVREKLSRAADRLALDARLGASEALAARSVEALAEADRASARTVALLSAEIENPSTGLAAAHASIGKVEEVLVGPSGASARAVTVLDVNGRVTGTYNTNDGHVGAFGVVADKFGVYHPTTGALLFYVDVDGAIAASFKPSVIGFDQLQMGASQKAMFYPVDADVVIQRGSTVQVVSLTFTKEDADSLLKVSFNGDFSSPDDLQFTGTFMLDGVGIKSTRTNIILVDANAAMPISPFAYKSGVAAGQHTITFTVTNNENDNQPLTISAGAAIEVVELRKASIGSVSGSGAAVIPGGGGTGGAGGGGSGGYVGGGGGRTPAQQ